jgi:replicative DNA helicase
MSGFSNKNDSFFQERRSTPLSPEESDNGLSAWKALPKAQRDKFIRRMSRKYDHLSNVEAEKALIASVLMSGGDNYWFASQLMPNDFFLPAHQAIWSAISERMMNGATHVDAASIIVPLRDSGAIYDIPDGENYIADLTQMAMTFSKSAAAESHAIDLKNLSKKRALLEIADKAVDALHDAKSVSFDVVVGDLCVHLMEEGSGVGSGLSLPVPVQQVRVEFVDSFCKGNAVPAIPTGIEVLDLAMEGGLHPHSFYGFVAAPKAGKTTLLGTIHSNICRQFSANHSAPWFTKYKSAPVYICLEMTAAQIELRNMARDLGVGTATFRPSSDGNPDPEVMNRLCDMLNTNHSGYFIDAPSARFDDLKRYCYMAVKKYGVCTIFIDYLGIISGKPPQMSNVEWHEMITMWIAAFVKRYPVSIAIAQQANSSGMVRGGDALPMAVDQLFLLHRGGEGTSVGWLALGQSRQTNSASVNLGHADNPSLFFNSNGPFIEMHPEFNEYRWPSTGVKETATVNGDGSAPLPTKRRTAKPKSTAPAALFGYTQD